MSSPAPREAIFDCSGEMAERFAAFDWSTTPLGPVGQWPASLRTASAVMLRSRFPMILSWGEKFVMLYNDAYIPTLGAKHPHALGGQLAEEFAEIWDAIGPMQRSVLAGGDATFHEDLPLVIERGHGPEETCFTFSYSHVPDEEGPGGVLAVLAITTGKVVGARRLALLNALAGRTTEVTSPDQALSACLDLLATDESDLLRGAAYLPDADGALLRSGTFGRVPDDWPSRVDAGAPGAVACAWSEGRVAEEPEEPAPDRATPHPARRLALPIRARGGVVAVLLVAPHPLRPLDEGHRRFLDLVGDQVSQVVALATARADEQARLEAMAAIDAAKSELLSSVSHEFRTPLTLLLGPLEDALEGRTDALDPATVAAMHQGAHRLLRMVSDLLDVAQLDAGGPVVDTEPTDVGELSKDLLGPFHGAAARSGLTFELRIDPGTGTVETDPRLWEKILLNLVSNAVKHTHRGGITVDLGAQRDALVLRVTDTGIGIPEEELDRVFERFHQVPGTSGRSVDGTGLGLALVAEAAHALGGGATVTSRPGEGSTFEVRVPLERTRDDVTVPAPHSEPVPPAVMAMAGELAGDLTSSLTGVPAADAARAGGSLPAYSPPWLGPGVEAPTILVVDDNNAMRARLHRVLSELGPVVACVDGEEALAVLRHAPVALVVTDVMMPKLDGVGLLQSIRADAALAPTPVVVLSARAGPEAATGALQAGADDYVVKPFMRGELLARCRTSLELARLRSEVTAARTRSTLIAGVSHDMQTPLSVIRAVLELLTEPEVDAELRMQLSTRALPRAHHLERMIRQFLDWSRLAVGTPITSYREPTQLGALVADAVAEYPQVAFTPPERPAVASCDPSRTQQILHNLISNAVRAARRDVEVRIHRVDPGDGDLPAALEVAVRDDGAGVPERVLPHLFTPFSPSTRDDGRGSGLGLHVSREAARAQGGDLVLASSDDQGATFVLRLMSEA